MDEVNGSQWIKSTEVNGLSYLEMLRMHWIFIAAVYGHLLRFFVVEDGYFK